MESVLERVRSDLLTISDQELPVVTVTLDLSPSPGGGPPTAGRIARDRLSAQVTETGRRDARFVRSVDADSATLEAGIEEATSSGAGGLLFAGCAGAGIGIELATALPFRNAIRLRSRPWLFELERYSYLASRPVSVILSDTHTMELIRVVEGEAEEVASVDHEQRYLRDKHGRGIAWNNITRSVRAHRAAFAKESAEEVVAAVGAEDVVLLAGVPDARAQLRAVLPPALAGRAVDAEGLELGMAADAVAALATELAVAGQYALADGFAREWLDRGGAIAAGERGVREALQRGQLGELVVHEDTAAHSGTARDTRYRAGVLPDDAVDAILRDALAQRVTLRFGREPSLLDRHEGLAGLLRW